MVEKKLTMGLLAIYAPVIQRQVYSVKGKGFNVHGHDGIAQSTDSGYSHSGANLRGARDEEVKHNPIVWSGGYVAV